MGMEISEFWVSKNIDERWRAEGERTHEYDIERPLGFFVGIQCFETVDRSSMVEFQFAHIRHEKLKVNFVVFHK